MRPQAWAKGTQQFTSSTKAAATPPREATGMPSHRLRVRFRARALARSTAGQIFTDEMGDEEKLRAIYRYIVEHTSYDYRYYQDPVVMPYESRTAYGPLEYGTAICGGFSWRSICSVKRQGFPAGTSPVWDLERIICGTAL